MAIMGSLLVPRIAGSQYNGSSGRIDPGWAQRNPDDAQARLTRAQFRRYRQEYLPITKEAIGKATADVEPQADAAGAMVTGEFQRAQGQTQRALARMGTAMTADEKRVASRLSNLDRGRAVATAENSTRRTLRDRNLTAMSDLINVGRDIQGSAGNALSEASGMKASRDAAGRQMKAQHRANTMSNVASGAGVGAALAAGAAGGLTAAGGAGLGAGAGLLLGLI